MTHPSTHWPELDWMPDGAGGWIAAVSGHPFCQINVLVRESGSKTRGTFVALTTGTCATAVYGPSMGAVLDVVQGSIRDLIDQLSARVKP